MSYIANIHTLYFIPDSHINSAVTTVIKRPTIILTFLKIVHLSAAK